MKYFNYGGNCTDRWLSIFEFIKQWTNVELRLKLDDSLINEYQEKIKIVLPKSIKYWIAFSHYSDNIEKYFTYRDCLVIERLKDHDAISLLLQGEDDYYWAVKSKDLESNDPIVTGYYLDYEDPDEKFIEQGIWAPSVSSFALDYLLSYFHASGGEFSTRIDSNIFSENEIENEFGECEEFGNLKIYNNKEVIIFINSNEVNWNNGQVKSIFRNPTDLVCLSPLLQKLHNNAHILSGKFANVD